MNNEALNSFSTVLPTLDHSKPSITNFTTLTDINSGSILCSKDSVSGQDSNNSDVDFFSLVQPIGIINNSTPILSSSSNDSRLM